MTPALRAAYPGVPPWEWEARPEWHARVSAGLRAEREAAQMIAQSQQDDEE